MFSKILIANRGEIACRVIKTARRMGIKTVAVYSEADAGALHVQMADEAVAIGPAPSAQSYLVADRIIQACLETGAEAVHPGYGFLSEKAAFCEALKAAGIAFIGPDVHAIGAMGDKIESKKLAKAAGVSTVPGYLGVIKDDEEAVRIAHDIGYPVMIKASAGGGGKGMRVAWDDAQTREGFRSASNEARSSFADDRVFIEKYVTEPRHIEIQVMADAHGNCVYLGERECSIQRRHQKVIEEAPSPFLDEATRKAMGEQAVALAQAVQYRSAGTVEFIVDKDRNFYFLEMNTRLQVEHPVTEMITGLDLVELMIRVAAGEKLPITQNDVKLNGWALEARVYAEEPTRNFLPSIGRVTRYRPPAEGPGAQEGSIVRVDTGIHEGGEISMFYDPMIAKLITYGPDRATAITAMGDALDRFQIRGVGHNISFLAALVESRRFGEGRLTTNFIAEEFPDGFHGRELPAEVLTRLLAMAASLHRTRVERDATISGQMAGHHRVVPATWVVRCGRDNHPAEIVAVEDGHDVTLDGRTYAVRNADWHPGQSLWAGTVDGHALAVQVDGTGIGYRLFHGGAELEVQVLTARAAEFAALMPIKAKPDMSKFLLSPMPGLLVTVAVAVGDEVKAGQELAVVEAMKMENILRAEADGTIKKIAAEKGTSLAVDQIIIEFE
ncbi:acetyl-CoA carboxylase biotin carboxylase subunit [Nitrospirillum amazonense]|uniref:propionyl-CoA carboxylase n=1 Tax=Nitrospirillum amazonense TaxID=28077 RepID=A0A560K2D8_9PROT|nr:acetyl/propionyl/methylcrotonyl-CoA carboxylase subunit alpha [Nitrospirillum amazonense]MDG3443846.1 acetyl/propionyl/methylcrotonyl-CoA carboxylase subunit alpha [Nitrospirillum amazonense]TWB77406.1 biotin carboxyl carrier protein /biotin carboxylase [Nitrospirillum amazonense]